MTVPPLLQALVDDAGLFPPEQLAMEAALDRHRADRRAGHPMLTHRFLCSASRLAELRAALGAGGGVPLRLAMVVDTGLGGLAPALAEAGSDARLVVELVELPLPGDDGAVAEALAALADVPAAAYLEPPPGPGWLDAVQVIAGWQGPVRRGAKVRCGGARAELFPTPAELASFVHVCSRDGVAFKATAGLHQAVRHYDGRTGFVHHGFLNLAVAACRAVAGACVEEITEVLAGEDPEPLVAEARAVPAATAAAARALFVAYGSCSTAEPIDDVAALGLMGGEAE